jgi:hypothetical protein
MIASPNVNPGHISRPAPNGKHSKSVPLKSTSLDSNPSIWHGRGRRSGAGGCRRRVDLLYE